MEILFIDESGYNKKEKNEYFILVGMALNKEKLLQLEEKIRDLKEQNKI